MSQVLYVPRRLLEETRTHLQKEAPREGVGLWAGRREVERVIPLPNAHPEPLVGYLAEPLALLRALKEMEREGLALLAIYHSHPRGPAFPSPTDIREARWRVPYVIFGTDGVRAFLLPEGLEVPVALLP
ncbi:metal-dependent protease of the PAD1/JAB1 superfamily [Thermus scotoductus]|uniref:Metal-dependent protease of the PAD1/JAB1 superfamily n=5 Tax=Thermus TaxID=270 RepID=A0A0N1KPY8_THESC|nr:M67 family metallopeptidase [Thermus brevis]KPD29402.1 metal-dependent protease of the PAD1/JAB1 superfamily [Thermus scotoductus]WCM39005.1 metal-dependent protease of the PAD1/JAB1 superfamily [Thermus antranikianii]RTG92414.1 metal-dependent protease of the PAD1/JAB1 superfamily [Thermus scotoductus]RTI01720.1 metal-dependent protease of the PAD1/JAB1 superfamily [Thermus scotoductus]RTI01885.1 metal-dependent protease of the PAD1/JAB1 superfamily [Thermus scotoductus]